MNTGGLMRKIAVTGYKGRLGSQFIYCGCDSLDCDITDPDSIKKAIDIVQPEVIINCAAITNVDSCESNEGFEKAMLVNTRGPNHLRTLFDGFLIHVSTDYIFSGKNGPYNEKEKKKDPVNAYGFTKWGGEIVLTYPILEGKTCIVRTTGLYGGVSNRSDFANMVLNKLRSGEDLYVSKELIGNQTYIPSLAEAILKMTLFPVFEHPIINIGSLETISRYDFAVMLAGVFGLDKSLIHPVRNDEIKEWVAKRPKKGGLSTGLANRLRLPIHTVLGGLKSYRDDTRGI